MRYNDPVLGKKIEDALADIKAADIPMVASRKIERLICLLDEPDADTARIISQIDDEADNLAAKGFVDEAEMVSDAIATLRQLGESKKSNRKSIRESDNSYIDDSKEETTPAAAAEKIVYDVYAALKAFGASRFMTIDEIRNIYEDLSDLRGSKAEDAAYEDFKSIASDLRGIADEVEDMGDYYEEAEALRYAAALLAGRVDESKKRKVLGRVSMKEAKKALKEDADREFEFEKKLSDAGLIFANKSKKVAISYDKNPTAFTKARQFADEVKDEFGGDYQIGIDSSGRATFTFTDQPIAYDDYEDEPIKAGEGSGELTDYQKSIIEDMAENDYEVGHPLSEEDALEWFSSGEEEDIPTDLAQEAANYYFEAFDQAREDDNSDYDEE